MNIPGLPDSMLNQQTWGNAQLEQLSLLLAAAASQMAGTALPLNVPGSSFQVAANANRQIPDGKSGIRYPEPDVKSLVYDPALGYRYDSSTGLHYDANSGLFINKKLETLLKYEKLTNTYERAGCTADITAPVLLKEFAELMGYDTPPTNLALEAPHTTENPQTTFPSVFPSSPKPEGRSPSYEEMSQSSNSPGAGNVVGKLSPQMISPSPRRRDHSLSPRPGRVRRRSSSDDRSRRGSKRTRGRSRSRSKSSTILIRKSSAHRDRSRSRSKDRGYVEGGNTFEEQMDAIARLHERNLKDPGNSFGRFLPRKLTFIEESELNIIMVTPLPPKGDREWGDLEILFKGILKANGVNYESVSVSPQNGNAPCDHCIVRFKKPPDAMRWYFIHQGALDLANPDGSKCTSYLYFSKLPWKCGFCKESNFPLRFFCYGCFKPQKIQKQMGTRAPLIATKMEGCKWVGLRLLDYGITSTQDVLQSLPPLDSFDIKSCEYMTEKNGLPLGLCIFEMADKESAKEFHVFLHKLKLNPVFLLVSSRVGLSENPQPYSRSACKSKPAWRSISELGTQTSLTNVNLGDYILRNWPVDTEKFNRKGTQTILVYKRL